MLRWHPLKHDISLCLSSHGARPGVLGTARILEVAPAAPQQAARPNLGPHVPWGQAGTLLAPLGGMLPHLLQLRAAVHGPHAILGSNLLTACWFLGYVARTLDLVVFPQSRVCSCNWDFRGLWLASASCVWRGWDPGEGLQCSVKWTSSFCLNLTLIFGTMGDLFLEPHFSETHLHATLPGFLVQIFCHLLLRQSVVSVLDEVL